MATGGTGAGLEPLGASAARAHEPWAGARALGLGCARGGRPAGTRNSAPSKRWRPPRAHLAAHPSPRARALAHGSCALAAEAPKGSGSALEPPVAMYFHKKGIVIIEILVSIFQGISFSSPKTYFQKKRPENKRRYSVRL